MNVHHAESNTWFCATHYIVLEAEHERCNLCPTPSPWVDAHCVDRWARRVSTAPHAISAITRIVVWGQRLTEPEWKAGFSGCAYYAHPAWPTAIIVVKLASNAAITVLPRGASAIADERLRLLSELLSGAGASA